MSIASQITALNTDKTDIANVITTKGGTLSQNYGFDTFAADIETISGGVNPEIISRTKTTISAADLNGVTSIGQNAFYSYRNLTNAILPSSVTAIYNEAFASSGLQSISLPDSITTLGIRSFQSCALQSVTIPNNSSLTTIPQECFYNNSRLLEVTIQENITSLGIMCFGWCSGLPAITLPNSVSYITGGSNSSSFYRCSSLQTIIIQRNTPPTLSGSGAFDNLPSDFTIIVPYSSDHSILDAYQNASNWSAYASHITDVALSA